MRRYGIDSPLLIANQIEALVAIGDWDGADTLSAAALRGITSSFPYWLLTIRAERRDRPRRARRRASAPRGGERHAARGPRARRSTTSYVAELALWERRWTDADAAVRRRVCAGARPPRGCADPRPAVRQGAARAGGAGRARARPPGRRRRPRPARPGAGAARRRAARCRRGLGGHAERGRLARPGRGGARARARRRAAGAVVGCGRDVGRLERPPLAAYCRWREAEALVAAGALARRGERAAPGGARRRDPHRGAAAAARARAARRAGAARSRVAGRGAAEGEQGLEEASV